MTISSITKLHVFIFSTKQDFSPKQLNQQHVGISRTIKRYIVVHYIVQLGTYILSWQGKYYYLDLHSTRHTQFQVKSSMESHWNMQGWESPIFPCQLILPSIHSENWGKNMILYLQYNSWIIHITKISKPSFHKKICQLCTSIYLYLEVPPAL